MKVNLDVSLKNQKGVPFGEKIQCLVLDSNNQLVKREDGNYHILEIENKDLKREVKDVIIESLLWEHPENKLTGDEKRKRYRLYQKFEQAKGSIDIESEDITLIKKCVEAIQSIIITGQIEDILEGRISK